MSEACGKGLAGNCPFSGTNPKPNPGDGAAAEDLDDREFKPETETRVDDRLPGMGNVNTESKSITDPLSGDSDGSLGEICSGERGAEFGKGEGKWEPMLLAGVGTAGWRNALSIRGISVSLQIFTPDEGLVGGD